ncbi:MAG: LacI family DNA-binding transcriptional regulator [Ruminococcus sp.]|nr:LacI family DNA-binding transcriptional regulator [Ruminococcus sp.]
MFKKNAKPRVIGIILEEIGTDFSKELIQGVVDAVPDDRSVRLIVLAGKYLNPEIDSANMLAYKAVYNSIFRLDEICDIDGLIIHLGSMSTRKKKVIKTGYSEKFQRIPKVFIASDIEGETVINYDNESGIREAVESLVNVNNLTNLCMLGGRDDNIDARARKQIFIRCLQENGVSFFDRNYESTDMSENCVDEALRLLERNPEVQAVFCVNDSVARGLYEAMGQKGLVPGRDILVFGFDNTRMAGEMKPPLTSIGADSCTLGQKALEVLLAKLDGKKSYSAFVPTRLYGRESMNYDMYDYTTMEMLNVNPSFIYRMFDDCFYRHHNSRLRREDVDLRRLYFEFIFRMLQSMKHRYMGPEEFHSLGKMIDVFFEKGAMEYTDAIKLVKCIEKLQAAVNSQQRSPAANIRINRLFQRMKDRAIYSLSVQKTVEHDLHYENVRMMHDFMVMSSTYGVHGDQRPDIVCRNIDKLGLTHAILYLFEKPVKYDLTSRLIFPEKIKLKCILRDNELYLLPKERQQCLIKEMFTRNEFSLKCKGYAAFPVFYEDVLYGVVMCGLVNNICDRGEYIAIQLGRAIYLERLRDSDRNNDNYPIPT